MSYIGLRDTHLSHLVKTFNWESTKRKYIFALGFPIALGGSWRKMGEYSYWGVDLLFLSLGVLRKPK